MLRVPATDSMETPLVASVHELYHAIANECTDDSPACCDLLSVCHTLVMVHSGPNTDGTATTMKALAAISFVLRHPTVVIMFVGVDAEFRAGGFGNLLLLLAGKCCIPPVEAVVNQAMVVRVHTDGHAEARLFFERRGFQPSDVTAFAATRWGKMPTLAADIVPHVSWMQPYVMLDINDGADVPLDWIWLELLKYAQLNRGASWSNCYALLPPACLNASCASPSIIKPACFCALAPNTLSNAHFNWCVKGLLLWDQDCFHEGSASSQDTSIDWHLPCQLSWRERLLFKGQHPVSPAVMTLLLSCMMRSASVPLWQ